MITAQSILVLAYHVPRQTVALKIAGISRDGAKISHREFPYHTLIDDLSSANNAPDVLSKDIQEQNGHKKLVQIGKP